jgi:hypothetical protein
LTAIPATTSATNFTALQTDTLGKIDKRLAHLAKLEQSVEASKSLSDTDKATLEQKLQGEVSGLQGLRQHVSSDTTAKDVKADAKSMVDDYRVYKVMTPQVHMSEQLAHTEQRYGKLETKVNAEQNPSADALAALANAKSAFDGQNAALLQLTPQDYSADMFSRFQQAVQSANSDLDTAAQIVHHA